MLARRTASSRQRWNASSANTCTRRGSVLKAAVWPQRTRFITVLTAIPDAHHYYRVEKVAFGTLTQLVLENAPVEEIETVAALCAIPLACRLRWRSNWILNRISRPKCAPSRKPPAQKVKLFITCWRRARMKCTPRCWSPTVWSTLLAGMGIRSEQYS